MAVSKNTVYAPNGYLSRENDEPVDGMGYPIFKPI
jgi:hypothetical protein